MNGLPLVLGIIFGVALGLASGLLWLGKMDANATATIVGSGLGAAVTIWGAFVVGWYQRRRDSQMFGKLASEIATNLNDGGLTAIMALDELAKFPRARSAAEAEPLENRSLFFEVKMQPRDEEYMAHLALKVELAALKETVAVFYEQVGHRGDGDLEFRLRLMRLRNEMSRYDKALEATLVAKVGEVRLTEEELSSIEDWLVAVTKASAYFGFNEPKAVEMPYLKKRFGDSAVEDHRVPRRRIAGIRVFG